jgi:hypothetical protein
MLAAYSQEPTTPDCITYYAADLVAHLHIRFLWNSIDGDTVILGTPGGGRLAQACLGT